MAELHDLTALEQAAAIGSREVSSLELVEHYLHRIDHHHELGAFLTVTGDEARAAAAAADRAVQDRAARDGGATGLPPLHGVPIAIKDLTSTAGVRTTFGSAVYADFVPEHDDDVVGFLRAAGTISVGKTNVPEFGLPCYTENRLTRPAVTPHDTSRLAGGSSGGAAAAVAAGLLPFAHGTDGGGSIRIPASVCGLVGLKTSRGRVSRGPLGSDPLGLSVHGPLARTAADAAALLDAMAVTVLSEPGFATDTGSGTFLSSTLKAAEDPNRNRRLRIGRTLDTPVPEITVDPVVLRAYEATSELLSELGHEVVDLSLPAPDGLMEAFLSCWAALTHGTPLPEGVEGLLMPLTVHLLERGRSITGPQLIEDFATIQSAARDLVRRTLPFDAVLTPALAMTPRPLDYFTGDGDPAADFARQVSFTPWTAQANMTGQPAINIPLQWTPDGLPIGMQFVGRPGDERTLLALCAELELAQPWAGHRPPAWDRPEAAVRPVRGV